MKNLFRYLFLALSITALTDLCFAQVESFNNLDAPLIENNFVTPFIFNANGNNNVTLQFQLNDKYGDFFKKNPNVKIDIFTENGTLVKTISENDLSLGYHTIYWDVRDDDGEFYQNGVYFFKITANDDFGNVKEYCNFFVVGSAFVNVSSPTENHTLTNGVEEISGIAVDYRGFSHFTLQYAAGNVDANNDQIAQWSGIPVSEELRSFTGEDYISVLQVHNGHLGMWNTKAINDGVYSLKLAVFNKSGENKVIYRHVEVINPLFIENMLLNRAVFCPNDIVNGNLKLSFDLNKNASIIINILNSNSIIIRTGMAETLNRTLGLNMPAHVFSWNGKDDSAVVVPEGRYTLSITATENGYTVQKSITVHVVSAEETAIKIIPLSPLADTIISPENGHLFTFSANGEGKKTKPLRVKFRLSVNGTVLRKTVIFPCYGGPVTLDLTSPHISLSEINQLGPFPYLDSTGTAFTYDDSPLFIRSDGPVNQTMVHPVKETEGEIKIFYENATPHDVKTVTIDMPIEEYTFHSNVDLSPFGAFDIDVKKIYTTPWQFNVDLFTQITNFTKTYQTGLSEISVTRYMGPLARLRWYVNAPRTFVGENIPFQKNMELQAELTYSSDGISIFDPEGKNVSGLFLKNILDIDGMAQNCVYTVSVEGITESGMTNFEVMDRYSDFAQIFFKSKGPAVEDAFVTSNSLDTIGGFSKLRTQFITSEDQRLVNGLVIGDDYVLLPQSGQTNITVEYLPDQNHIIIDKWQTRFEDKQGEELQDIAVIKQNESNYSFTLVEYHAKQYIDIKAQVESETLGQYYEIICSAQDNSYRQIVKKRLLSISGLMHGIWDVTDVSEGEYNVDIFVYSATGYNSKRIPITVKKPYTGEIVLTRNIYAPEDELLGIKARTTKESYLDVKVYSQVTGEIRTLTNNQYAGVNQYLEMVWDGNDNLGNRASDGNYLIIMTARTVKNDQYGQSLDTVAFTNAVEIQTGVTELELTVSTSSPLITPNDDGINDRLLITYSDNTRSKIGIYIKNSVGEIVKNIKTDDIDDYFSPKGQYSAEWECKDLAGLPVVSGRYILEVHGISCGNVYDKLVTIPVEVRHAVIDSSVVIASPKDNQVLTGDNGAYYVLNVKPLGYEYPPVPINAHFDFRYYGKEYVNYNTTIPYNLSIPVEDNCFCQCIGKPPLKCPEQDFYNPTPKSTADVPGHLFHYTHYLDSYTYASHISSIRIEGNHIAYIANFDIHKKRWWGTINPSISGRFLMFYYVPYDIYWTESKSFKQNIYENNSELFIPDSPPDDVEVLSMQGKTETVTADNPADEGYLELNTSGYNSSRKGYTYYLKSHKNVYWTDQFKTLGANSITYDATKPADIQNKSASDIYYNLTGPLREHVYISNYLVELQTSSKGVYLSNGYDQHAGKKPTSIYTGQSGDFSVVLDRDRERRYLEIIGSTGLETASYKMFYSSGTNVNDARWEKIDIDTTYPQGNILCRWDTTFLYGKYLLLLQVTKNNGNLIEKVSRVNIGNVASREGGGNAISPFSTVRVDFPINAIPESAEDMLPETPPRDVLVDILPINRDDLTTAANFHIIGPVFSMRPAGIMFDEAAVLTYQYTDEMGAEYASQYGTNWESRLGTYHVKKDGTIEYLPGYVDKINNQIVVNIPGFSDYALVFDDTEVQKPVLDILPDLISYNDVRIGGKAPANHSVKLMINNIEKGITEIDSSGKFEFNGMQLVEGRNTIQVICLNQRGVESVPVIKETTVDTRKPLVSATNDKVIYLSRANRLTGATINASMDKDGKLLFMINYQSGMIYKTFEKSVIKNQPVSIQLADYIPVTDEAQKYYLYIKGVDNAGNVNVDTSGKMVEVIIDVNDPQINYPVLSTDRISTGISNGLAILNFTLADEESTDFLLRAVVVDESGALTTVLRDWTKEKAGKNQVIWDGRSDSGISYPDGKYYIQLQTADKAKNLSGVTTLSVILDNSSPVDEQKIYLASKYITAINNNLVVTYAANEDHWAEIWIYDSNNTMILSNISGMINSANETKLSISVSFGQSGTLLPDGVYRVEAKFIDAGGNTQIWSDFCIVDTEPPVVRIDSPATGSNCSGIINVLGEVSDINFKSYTVILSNTNGFTANFGNVYTPVQSGKQLLIFDSGNLYGDFTLQIKTVDLAGNVRVLEQPLSFVNTPDNTLIFASLDSKNVISRAANSTLTTIYLDVTAKADVLLNVNVTDTFSQIVRNLIIDKILPASNEISTLWMGEDNASNGVVDGEYIIVVQAVHGTNTVEKRFPVIVDSAAPVVLFTGPVDNSWVEGTLQIKGSITDANLEKYEVDIKSGDDINVRKNLKTAYTVENSVLLNLSTINLVDGHTYEIVVTAYDKAGNVSGNRLRFRPDNTKPEVIINPFSADNIIRSGSDVILSGVAYDNFLTHYEISLMRPGESGYTVIKSDTSSYEGAFLKLSNLVLEGTYSIKIEASDEIGHFTSRQYSFNVITSQINAEIQNLSQSVNMISGEFLIKGTASSSNFSSYTIAYSSSLEGNYTEIVTSESPVVNSGLGVWNTLLLNGTYFVKLTVTDTFGINAEITKEVYIDNKAPVLTIAAPTYNYLTKSDIPMSFTLHDDTLLSKVEIYLKNETEELIFENYISDENYSYNQAYPVGTKNGSHTLIYRTKDVAGNQTEVKIPVIIDTVAPEVVITDLFPTIIHPKNINKNAMLYFTLSEKAAVTIVVSRSNINGVLTPVRTLMNKMYLTASNYSVAWDGKNTLRENVEDGDYVITISAMDTIGNISIPQERSLKVLFDTEPPVVTLNMQYSLFSPQQNNKKDTTALTAHVNDNKFSEVLFNLVVKDTNDQLVKELIPVSRVNVGEHNSIWNGRFTDGAYVPDGLYNFRSYRQDGAGNSIDTIIGYVTVDNTIPIISDINIPVIYLSPGILDGKHDESPLFLSVSEQGSLSITVLNEQGNKVKNLYHGSCQGQAYTYYLNGLDDDGKYMSDGHYTVILNSEDLAGNDAVEKTISFVIDNTYPEISFANMPMYLKGNAQISAAVNEVNPEKIIVSYKDLNETNGQYRQLFLQDNNPSTNVECSWDTTALSHSEGIYNIRIDVLDKAQNFRTKTRFVRVDNVAPVASLSVEGSSNNGIWSGKLVIKAIAQDTFLDEYRLYYGEGGTPTTWTPLPLITARVGEPFISTEDSVSNQNIASWSTFGLSGTYTLKLEVKDKVGNVTIAQQIIEIDSIAPVLSGLSITPEIQSIPQSHIVESTYTVNENCTVRAEILSENALYSYSAKAYGTRMEYPLINASITIKAKGTENQLDLIMQDIGGLKQNPYYPVKSTYIQRMMAGGGSGGAGNWDFSHAIKALDAVTVTSPYINFGSVSHIEYNAEQLAALGLLYNRTIGLGIQLYQNQPWEVLKVENIVVSAKEYTILVIPDELLVNGLQIDPNGNPAQYEITVNDNPDLINVELIQTNSKYVIRIKALDSTIIADSAWDTSKDSAGIQSGKLSANGNLLFNNLSLAFDEQGNAQSRVHDICQEALQETGYELPRSASVDIVVGHWKIALVYSDGQTVNSNVGILENSNLPEAEISSNGLFTVQMKATLSALRTMCDDFFINSGLVAITNDDFNGYNDFGQALPDGQYIFKFTAADMADNKTFDWKNFHIDSTAPVITVTFPESNQIVSGLVEVQGTVSDNYFFDRYTIFLKPINSNVWQIINEAATEVNNGSLGMFDGVLFAEGSYDLKIIASDKVQNSNTIIIPITVYPDPDALLAVISCGDYISPDDDGIKDTMEFKYRLLEESAVTIKILDSASNIVHIVQKNVTQEKNDYSIEFDGKDSNSIVLPDGRYFISVEAEAGTALAKRQVLFVVDTVRPVVDLTKPINGSFVSDLTMVYAAINDLNFKYLSLAYNSSGTNYIEILHSSDLKYNTGIETFLTVYQIPLQDGTYTIRLTVVDKAGNATTIYSAVERDKTQPLVSISLDDYQYVRGNISFSLSATDKNLTGWSLTKNQDGIETLLDEGVSPLNNHVKVLNTAAYQDGVCAISLNAYDANSNMAISEKHIIIDNTKPLLVIENPVENALCGGVVKITGSAIDANLKTFVLSYVLNNDITTNLIQQGIVNVVGGVLGELSSAGMNGSCKLILTAEDRSGNMYTTNRTFVIDNNAPYISVEAPTENSILSGTVNISGSIIDSNLQTAQVSYRKVNTVNSVLIEEITQNVYSSQIAALQTEDLDDGRYIISINAVDKISNQTKKELIVSTDNHAPDVDIQIPGEGGQYSGTLTVRGTISDPFLSTIEIQLKHSYENLYTTIFTGTESFVSEDIFSFDTRNYNGDVQLKIIAKDVLGRETIKINNFKLDNAPPVITIIDDGNNPFIPVNEQQKVVVSISEQSFVNAVVYKEDGIKVIDIYEDQSIGAGNIEIIWDGKNTNGQIVESGNYYLSISARDSFNHVSDTVKIPFEVQYDIIAPDLASLTLSRSNATFGDYAIHPEKTRITIYGNIVEELSKNITMTISVLSAQGLNCVGVIMTNFITMPGPFSHTWKGYVNVGGNTQKIADGNYLLSVNVTDAAGNASSKIFSISIDSSAPIATVQMAPIISTESGQESWPVSCTVANLNQPYTAKVLIKDRHNLVMNTVLDETVTNVSNFVVDFIGKNENNGNNLEEGTYKVVLQAYDENGNQTETTCDFLIDNALPVVTITQPIEDSYMMEIFTNADGLGEYRISVSVIEATPVSLAARMKERNEIVWQEQNLPLQNAGLLGLLFLRPIADGIYDVEVSVKDAANQLGTTNVTFKVDTTSPVISCDVLSVIYSNLYVNSAYQINVASVDPQINGVSSGNMHIIIATNDFYQVYETTNLALILSEGTNNVEIFSSDNANNMSETVVRQFILDVKPPVADITVVGNQCTNINKIYVDSSTTFNLTAIDDYSGVTGNYYSFDGITFMPGDTLSGLTNEGETTVYYYSIDNVGNKGRTQTKTVIVDNSTPISILTTSLEILEIGGVKYLPVGAQAILNAHDAYSGVKNIFIKVNDGEYEENTLPYAITNAGTFTINFYAEDNLGHKELAKTFTVTTPYPDMTPPETTLHLSQVPFIGQDGISYLNRQVFAKLTAIDKLGINDGTATGVAGIEYRIDFLTNWTAYTSNEKITFTEGKHAIYYRSYDFIPNTENTHSNLFAFDGSVPISSAMIKKADGTVITANAENVIGNGYSLILTAEDPLVASVSSGIKRLEYRIDNGSWKSYTTPLLLVSVNKDDFMLSYRALDNVQNSETASTIHFLKDVSAPVVTINSPFYGVIVNNDVPVFGTVTDDRLSNFIVSVIDSSGSANIIAQGHNPISGQLGIWQLGSNIPNGSYVIRINAVDTMGNSSSTEVTVQVGPPEHVLTYGENYPGNCHNAQYGKYWSLFNKYKIDKVIRNWGNIHQMNGFIPYDELRLGLPTGLDLSVNDFVYVADESAGLVRVLDGLGNQLYTYDNFYEYPIFFRGLKKPVSVTFTEAGKYYIVDKTGNWVHYFQYDGKYLYSIGNGGVKILDLMGRPDIHCPPSTDSGYFNRPLSAAVDKNGKLYVADTGNNRVQIFGANGVYENIITGFISPVGVSVIERNGSLQSEEVWVADSGRNLLQVYTTAGIKIGTFNGTNASGLSGAQLVSGKNIVLSRPVAISTDDNGQVVVIDEVIISDDKTISRAQRYDRYLNLITVFSNVVTQDGNAQKNFNQARGISFDASKRHLFLSDSRNHHVYKLKLTTKGFLDTIAPVANLRMTVEKTITKQPNRRNHYKKAELTNSSLTIFGEAADAYFSEAIISYGVGESPTLYHVIDRLVLPVWKGLLTRWNIAGINEGIYALKLDVFDLSGNIATDTMIVEITGDKVDVTKDEVDSGNLAHKNTAPNVPQNVVISNGFVKANENVSVSWTFSDPDEADIQSGFIITITNGTFGFTEKIVSTVPAQQSKYVFSSSVLNRDGIYKVIVKVIDSHGLESEESEAKTFTYDTTLPEIKINSPADGSVYYGQAVLDISANDINLEEILVKLNGTNVPLHKVVNAPGYYALSVFAQDRAGNISTSQLNFTVLPTNTDENPVIIQPTLTVIGISNGYYCEAVAGQVIFTGSFLEKKTYINDILQTIYVDTTDKSTLYFSLSNDGDYKLFAEGTDINGIRYTELYQFVIDRQAPIIVVNNLSNGMFTVPVIPQITVSGDSNYTMMMTLNGVEYFSGTTISENGLHNLSIVAKDIAGNTASKSISFTVDSISPVITVTGISSGSHYSDNRDVSIQVTDINLKSTTITLNGQVMPQSSYTIVQEGNYTNIVRAEDKAGNISIRVDIFTIDKTLPIVLVEGIKSNMIYARPSIDTKIYEPNFDLNRSSVYLNSESLISRVTNATDEFSIPYYRLSVTNITNIGANIFSYVIYDKASNNVHNSIPFNVIAFDSHSNLSAFASYDINSKFTWSIGDSNEYSLLPGISVGGYRSNCIAPGQSFLDKVVKYRSEENISDRKGTIACWAKVNWTHSAPDGNYIFALKNSDSDSRDGYSLSASIKNQDGTVFALRNKNNNLFKIEFEKTIPEENRWYSDSEWHYLTFTWDYDSAISRLYIDGLLRAEETISGTAKENSKWFIVGASRDGMFTGFDSFNGRIDELRIYSKALNSSDVNMLYESEK